MSQPTLEVTSDFTKDFNNIVKGFKSDAVLIGIPEQEKDRKAVDEKGKAVPEQNDPITNAALLAINEFGSPLNNIPARPVMAIGIRNAQADIADTFASAVKMALSKGLSALNIYYNRVGIIASNSVKKAINDQDGIEHIAFSTALSRLRAGFKGEKALIVTGQLRNSITYVVKDET